MIDPSIALGVQVPQFESPFKLMSNIMQLRELQQQNTLREMQMQEHRLNLQQQQREEQDTRLIQSVFQKMTPLGGEPDLNAVQREVRFASPQAGLKLEKLIQDRAKEQLQMLNTTLDTQQKAMGQNRSFLQGVYDDEDETNAARRYSDIVPTLWKNTPELKTVIPEVYPGKPRVKEMLSYGETASERLARMKDGVKMVKDAQQGTESWGKTAAHNLSIFGDTPEGWDQAKSALKLQGAPSAILDQYGGFSSENLERAKKVALAPDASEKRQVETFKEAAARLAAQPTIDAYTRAWSAMPDAIALKFPTPAEWDAKTTPKYVRSLALTPEQQQQAETARVGESIRAAAEANLEKYRAWTMAGGQSNKPLSGAQRGVAERNLNLDLRKLEAAHKKDVSGLGTALTQEENNGEPWTIPPAETTAKTFGPWMATQRATRKQQLQDELDAQLEDEKLRAMNSYRTQLGLESVSELPPEWQTWKTRPSRSLQSTPPASSVPAPRPREQSQLFPSSAISPNFGLAPSGQLASAGPDVFARARDVLRANGRDSSDTSVRIFLSSRVNQQALGLGGFAGNSLA